MSEFQPYILEIVQGATLFREIAVLDSERNEVDVSNVTLYAEGLGRHY